MSKFNNVKCEVQIRKCYICHDQCNIPNTASTCNPKNDCAYTHKECLNDWIKRSNAKKCTLCFSDYNVPQMLRIWVTIMVHCKMLWTAFDELCEWDLINGIRWDEYFD